MLRLEEDDLPLDVHPRFRRLFDYLAAKAPPGKLAGRRHIDPVEIPELLPYLLLIEVVRDAKGEPRFRNRLVGTEIVALQGEDTTGKFVDEVVMKASGIVAGYRDILTTRQPQHRSGYAAIPGREHIAYERIAFPLANDGENVDMLIIVFAIQPRAGAAAS